MKQIIAFVKPFRAEAVLKALGEADVEFCVVSEAKGYGRQKGYLDRYMGSEYSMAFLPKVQIVVWAADEQVEHVIGKIVSAGRTGRMGDGKLLVLPVLESLSLDS